MGRRRRVTDEQIVAVARDCFEEFGADVSMDTIARRIGVSAPAIYIRFGSKLNLFYESVLPKRLFETDRFVVLRSEPDERAIGLQILELSEDLAHLCEEMIDVVHRIARNPIRLTEVLELVDAPWPASVLEALSRWLDGGARANRFLCEDTEFFAAFWLGAIYSQIARLREDGEGLSPCDRSAITRKCAVQIARSLGVGLGPDGLSN